MTSFRDNEGRQIEARAWALENIFKPLDGYKVWARGPKCCAEHRALIGLLKPKRALCNVAPHEGCDGLKGEKIFFVVIDVTRQEGKTTAGACYILSELVDGRNCHMLYLAASESQSDKVFDQKFVGLLRSRPDLVSPVGALDVGMDSIVNQKRNNSFKYVPTSLRSIAAGTFRLIFADETREMDPELLVKLVAQIMAVSGVECPHGHMTASRPVCPTCLEPVDGFECEAHGPIPLPRCPACGIDLEEFFGRAALMSSAGEESAIHTELVEFLKEHPQPNWHLFSTTDRLNKAKVSAIVDAAGGVFGEMDATRAIFNREFRNVPGSKGDDFLPKPAIALITDPGLRNFDFYERPCIGFLDCSLTTDLTSLVIVGDFSAKGRPAWTSIVAIRIDEFDPAEFPGGRVRYKHDKDRPGDLSIQLHLTEAIPRFPGLVELWIDTTLLEDARDLYTWAKGQPWGGRVFEYPPDHDKQLVKQMMWDSLEARVLAGPRQLRIPKLPRLVKELESAKTKVGEAGNRKVMDSIRGDSRRKGRRHRDISMSLAGCCWRANMKLARAIANTRGVVDRLNESMALNTRFRPIAAGLSTERY
jgi:hypothetical protein